MHILASTIGPKQMLENLLCNDQIELLLTSRLRDIKLRINNALIVPESHPSAPGVA
jgi:hypothetical protein